MGLSRNQRRMVAKKRAAMRATEAANNAAIIARKAIVRANLGRTPARDNSNGLTSTIYSGAANPLGYTRPLRWSKGAA